MASLISSGPSLMLSAFYIICCTSLAFLTGWKWLISVGMTLVAGFLTQYIVQGWITGMIGLKQVFYLIVMWALSILVLQIDILITCQKISLDTLKICAINALGGSIASAIVSLVFDIVFAVLPQLKVIRTVIGYLPFIGDAISKVFDAIILSHTNLLFGFLIARNVAIGQACPDEGEEEGEEE
jgi:hypothetical protein